VIAIVAHSGGPTAVLNASLLGVVQEAKRDPRITSLLGARFGIDGIIADDFIELLDVAPRTLADACQAPASALGTSRRVVTTPDFDRVLAVCRARGVDCLFYTGGNGSMETAQEIANAGGDALSVIGVPKTIDNDLAVTDHAPGYGSAARFFACAARDIGADNHALPDQVQVIEVLGRNAGWVAAATSLVRRDPDDAPHLIYVPERRLPLDRLLDDVRRVFSRLRRCVVVVCEGQLDEHGEPFGADARMSSRGLLATNLGHTLARLITDRTGLKARAEKPGLFGRSARALRSEVDWRESRLCGQAAVRAALDGASGVMITLERERRSPYSVTTGVTPLARVAGIERLLPEEWIGADGCSILPTFREYALPLVGDLEPAGWL
jgi:6-phosphofructokinase 1